MEAERVVFEGSAVAMAHEEADEARVGVAHRVCPFPEADASRVDHREIVCHGAVESDETVVEDWLGVGGQLGHGARKRREYTLARGVPITKPAASREVDLASIRLHVLDWDGAEPPILLLHPNRTNARVWDFVVEHSTLPNRFIAPDQRGHGL
ncbi:MAG: alpha/beta fold hydrolase, partial [Gaiellaceae bacterium]